LIEIGSKTAEKALHKQTDKQTRQKIVWSLGREPIRRVK